MAADQAEINLEDQEETQCRPCTFVNLKLLGLHVSIVFDSIFGMAYLSRTKDENSLPQLRLSLIALHMSIR